MAARLRLRPALLIGAALALCLGRGAPALAAPGPGFTVVLDAGHGGLDPGALNPLGGPAEKDITLRLALLTGGALQRRGVSVIYTRADDRFVSLQERAGLARRAGAQALLSLHLNSAPTPAISGAEAWYGSGPRDGELAATVLDALAGPARAYGVPVRGLRPGATLAVLRAPVPAALVELGYLSHAGDARALSQQAFLAAAAEALAEGIVRFRDGRSTMRAPGGAAAASAVAAAATYVVAPGDTLSDIAAATRSSVPELMGLNGLANPHLIQVGQTLRLRAGPRQAGADTPAGPAGPANRRYRVQPGDTLSGIALRFGVPVEALVRSNGLRHPDFVVAGMVLALP